MDLLSLAKAIKDTVSTAKQKAVSSSSSKAQAPIKTKTSLSKLLSIPKAHAAPTDFDEMRKIATGQGSTEGGTNFDEMRSIANGQSKPQPKPLIQLRQEQQAQFQMPKNESTGDFVSRFGKNLLNTPGQLVGGIGDIVTGKAGEKIKTAQDRYVADVKAGYEEPLIKGVSGEVTQMLAGALGEAPRIAGHFADFAKSAIPVINQLPNINPTTNALGDAIEGTGTAVTGVPKESASGEIGRTATAITSLFAPSKAIESATELIPGLQKAERGLGSLWRGKKILEGSSTITEGGPIINRTEKILNFTEKALKGWARSSIKGAADTALYTGATEGRAPKADELAMGVAIGNVADMIGGFFKKNATDTYRKSINLFSGNNETPETLVKKSQQAIEEGFTGGKNPEKYRQLASEKISSYGKVVDDEMKKNGITFGDEFYNQAYADIASMEKYDPAQSKVMRDALDEISGKAHIKKMTELDSQIAEVGQGLEELSQSAEYLSNQKKPSIISINKNKSAIRSKHAEIERLMKKRIEVARVAEVTSNPKNLEDLRRIKQIAAERNPSIVGGISAPSAKDAAVNKVWMMLRDNAETYLNKQIPHLADINGRLNVAYRVMDAVEPYVKAADSLKKGSKLVEAKYFTGQALQSSPVKTSLRRLLLKNYKTAKDISGKAYVVGENLVNGATNSLTNLISGGNNDK